MVLNFHEIFGSAEKHSYNLNLYRVVTWFVYFFSVFKSKFSISLKEIHTANKFTIYINIINMN